MENMVWWRKQFLETEKDTDGARHNHHQRADVIPFVPNGNRKANPHEHRKDAYDHPNTQNQLVELFSFHRNSLLEVLQIYKIARAKSYDDITILSP